MMEKIDENHAADKNYGIFLKASDYKGEQYSASSDPAQKVYQGDCMVDPKVS